MISWRTATLISDEVRWDPSSGHEDQLSDQVDALGTPHGRNQLGRVDRQTADIGRTQGVIDRLQIGGGQYQGVVAQGGLDGQGPAVCRRE